MDIIALIGAVMFIATFIIVKILSRKITVRWLRYLVVAMILPASFLSLVTVMMIFSAPVSSAVSAGTYTFFLGILTLVVYLIFFRKKNKNS